MKKNTICSTFRRCSRVFGGGAALLGRQLRLPIRWSNQIRILNHKSQKTRFLLLFRKQKEHFKEFDPTRSTDPTQPDPDPTDPAWVDVKISNKNLIWFKPGCKYRYYFSTL